MPNGSSVSVPVSSEVLPTDYDGRTFLVNSYRGKEEEEED